MDGKVLHESAPWLKPIELLGEAKNIKLHISQPVCQDHSESTAGLDTIVGRKWKYDMAVNRSFDEHGQSGIHGVSTGNNGSTLVLYDFKPGSVLVVEVEPAADAGKAVAELDATEAEWKSAVATELAALNLTEMNFVLYRCQQEENAEFGEGGPYGPTVQVYDVPGLGRLQYCGLQGLMTAIETAVPANDLAHAVCNTLREGNWLIDYHANRLDRRPEGKKLAAVLRSRFDRIGRLPRSVIPAQFLADFSYVYDAAIQTSYSKMSPLVQNGSAFVKDLVMAGIQLYGSEDGPTGKVEMLAAGLPFFASGWMRTWGRDTFIALRGNLILAGRFKEAKNMIRMFAETTRHGLIPNLLDRGEKPRFNCRDAAWWFLQSIQDYAELAPEGNDILNMEIMRNFPFDDQEKYRHLYVFSPLPDCRRTVRREESARACGRGGLGHLDIDAACCFGLWATGIPTSSSARASRSTCRPKLS